MVSAGLNAQERRFILSGELRDSNNGEELPGASIYEVNTQRGLMANSEGYFALSLPRGTYTLKFNYLGYRNKEITIELRSDTLLNIKLESFSTAFGHLRIYFNRYYAAFRSYQPLDSFFRL